MSIRTVIQFSRQCVGKHSSKPSYRRSDRQTIWETSNRGHLVESNVRRNEKRAQRVSCKLNSAIRPRIAVHGIDPIRTWMSRWSDDRKRRRDGSKAAVRIPNHSEQRLAIEELSADYQKRLDGIAIPIRSLLASIARATGDFAASRSRGGKLVPRTGRLAATRRDVSEERHVARGITEYFPDGRADECPATRTRFYNN